jgi:hypothetical protein
MFLPQKDEMRIKQNLENPTLKVSGKMSVPSTQGSNEGY